VGETPSKCPEHGRAQYSGRALVNVTQRSGVAIPGSGNAVVVSIGDITRGRTRLSVSHRDGTELVVSTMVTQGDELSFELDSVRYRLVVEELRNLLIGDDYAVIEVGEDRR